MCYVLYVLLWIKYWLMWFEIILVFILFKKTNKKNSSQTPNIYGIRVVQIFFTFIWVHCWFFATICEIY